MATERPLDRLRREYTGEALNTENVAADPFEQFTRWYRIAEEVEPVEANAMVLATAAENGVPAARIVLLKGYDPDGFRFYTNYESLKGQHLDANPNASVLFWWPTLARQIRITGRVERTSPEDSDAYFSTRPRGSQLSARISDQSRPVPSRAELEDAYRRADETFREEPVPRPDDWGGYRLVPSEYEFWQGRDNRLHDRIVYTRTGRDGWGLARIAP